MNWLRKIYEVWDPILAQPLHETVLRMTLILLILHSQPTWLMQVPLRIVCLMMLIGRGLEKNRVLWGLVCAMQVYQYSLMRFNIDNHKYLITYWSLVCLLSVFAREPAKVLSWNSRLLIGLTFVLAANWKWLGGEYLNGEFFSFMLVTHPLFQGTPLGNVPMSVVSANEELLNLMRLFPHEGFAVAVNPPPSVVRLGVGLGWATFVGEALVGLAFLVSKFRPLHELRHVLLIGFALVTYALLPVIGFAFALMVMGFAETPTDDQETRRWYLWALVLVQISVVPFNIWGS